MATVHLEAETKYDVDDDLAVPSLVEVFGSVRDRVDGLGADGSPWAEGDGVEQHLRATYYDTADLDLAAAGLTLRRRTGGDDAGWHLKVPTPAGDRSEVRVPLEESESTVPDRLAAMTHARTGGRPLVPVVRLETERTVRRLVDPTGRVLVELADDRVTAHRLVPTATGPQGPGTTPEGSAPDDGAAHEQAVAEPATWREIEVELVDAPRDLLAAVDPLLRERGLVPAATSSKLVRALGADVVAAARRAHGVPDGTSRTSGTSTSSKPPRRRRSDPAADVVLAQVAAQVEQIRAQDLPVRLDAAGAVHAMRVATRRLRSTLRTFEPLFRRRVTRPLADELRWLAGVLGTARDAEVMRERVGSAVTDEPATARLDDTVADQVDGRLDGDYRSAHDDLVAVLEGERYRALLDALAALLDDPPLTPRAGRPAGDVLPRLVSASHADVRSAMKGARRTDDPEERVRRQHRARKAAKRTRYAAESVTPVLGKRARRLATAMEALQESLGDHLDSLHARERLVDLASEATTPGAAFTYGRLHAREEARDERAQAEVRAAWAVASRKRLRRRLR